MVATGGPFERHGPDRTHVSGNASGGRRGGQARARARPPAAASASADVEVRPPLRRSTMGAWPQPPTTYGERTKPAPDTAPVRRSISTRSSIALADLTPNNVGQLRKLNAQLFPIAYSEQVYQQVLDEDVRPLCKLGLFNDIPVSNVCCRVEEGKDVAHAKIYIMTLGVLPAYRRLGIATALLQQVLNSAPPGGRFDGQRVETVYLHVHTGNAPARAFYEHFGFQVTGTVPNYYQKLDPPSAWVLEKRA